MPTLWRALSALSDSSATVLASATPASFRLAADTLKAIERNKALLVKPRSAHGQWLFARLAPGLMQRASIGFIKNQRSHQAAAGRDFR